MTTRTAVLESMAGEVHIITGAAMGLGKAVAIELAQRGAKLVLIDYNVEALVEVTNELMESHPDGCFLPIVTNMSNETAVREAIEKTVETFGRIDGLYNNAGIEGRQAPLVDYDLTQFKRVIDVNLMGVYYAMRYVIPVMQLQEYGRIVNASSVGGIRGVQHQTPYVASKHAVIGMTKNAAIEYGKFGVIVNAISPGAIVTPMVAEAFKQVNPSDPQAAESAYAQRNPMRRLGQPNEVAKVVAFLLSRDNSYVNGQTLAIDGGESNLYGNA